MMNADKAMTAAKAYLANEQDGELLLEAEEVAITLAKEVERLRAELKVADKWLHERSEAYSKTCSMVYQLKKELAAAKVATELPVEIQSVYVNKYLGSVVVFIGDEKGAVEFDAWLCDRVKERGE